MLLHHFRVLGLTLPPSDAYLSLCELVFGNLWKLLMLLHPFCVLGLTLPPSDAHLSLCELVLGNFWKLLMLLHPFCVLDLTLSSSDAHLSLCELVFGNLWNLLMPLNHFRVLGLALPPSDARLLLLASATIQAVVLTKTPTSNIQEVFHVTSRRPTSRIRRRRIATIGTLDQVCVDRSRYALRVSQGAQSCSSKTVTELQH